jgi:formylglycine-generating enzyme required for sulfatase activity
MEKDFLKNRRPNLFALARKMLFNNATFSVLLSVAIIATVFSEFRLPPIAGKYKIYKKWPFTPREASEMQRETGAALSLPVHVTLDLREPMLMSLIPAGEWRSQAYEGTTFVNDRPYYIADYETTRGQWEAYMRRAIFRVERRVCSPHPDKQLPVSVTSWPGASLFLKQLNDFVGVKAFRLPWFVEWDYACRAGSPCRFFSGNNEADLSAVGWWEENYYEEEDKYGEILHPVGKKRPNAFGLYDTHGNVSEYCAEGSHNRRLPKVRLVNHRSSSRCGGAIRRGGMALDAAYGCANDTNPRVRALFFRGGGGFRIVLDVGHAQKLLKDGVLKASKITSGHGKRTVIKEAKK